MDTTGASGAFHAHPRVVDVVVVAATLPLALSAGPPGFIASQMSAAAPGPPAVAMIVVGSASLMFRRSRPRAVWLVTLSLAVVALPLAGAPTRGVPALVAALFALAAYTDRRWALVGALTSIAGVVAVTLAAAPAAIGGTIAFGLGTACGMAAALGDAVRSNRAVLAAAEERARRAEAARDEVARARVAEERLRISRELHDVVVHHIAVINVQAGVAEHLVAISPAQAAVALGHVREASREARAEMRALVGLLRTDETGGALDPAPGLADLPALVDSLRLAGEPVVWHRSGPDRRLPTRLDVHAFRIAQEALTNAAKHGRGPIDLTTAQDAAGLRIEVTNPIAAAAPGAGAAGAAAAAGRAGHGLVGMRERVALCGGTMMAGPIAHSTYRVQVTLPFVVDGGPEAPEVPDGPDAPDYHDGPDSLEDHP